VSKKTIAFTMPAGGRRPRQRKPVVLDGVTGENVSFAADEQTLRDAGGESRSDAWVGESASNAEPSPIPDPALPALAVGASMTIDLSAERSLMEAMTLSYALPFALGWFWFARALARRQRLWGA
jgi:hypothetical protein